jgi:hypothetical protein
MLSANCSVDDSATIRVLVLRVGNVPLDEFERQVFFLPDDENDVLAVLRSARRVVQVEWLRARFSTVDGSTLDLFAATAAPVQHAKPSYGSPRRSEHQVCTGWMIYINT